MLFSKLSESQRVALLEPPQGKIQLVLDTDTYNEIDDQFAVVYALLSPEKLAVEAIYAAPFEGHKAPGGPGEGMEKSYAEILRLLKLLGRSPEGFVFKGSTAWLPGLDQPVISPAAADLIARARAARDTPLYVVAIGAITNIASAILAAPEIIDKIVVVWLGGNPHYWHPGAEYNVYQDMLAAQVIFDSGVPLVHVPCINVTEHLRTTQAELAQFVKGRGAVGDYLFQIFSDYYPGHFGRSKEIWDIGPLGWLINPAWAKSSLIHSPLLTIGRTWSHDPQRHLIRELISLDRDAIFGDLFTKLENAARQ
jgi:inosine-uridine nucleoside N-ribohydrolase